MGAAFPAGHSPGGQGSPRNGAPPTWSPPASSRPSRRRGTLVGNRESTAAQPRGPGSARRPGAKGHLLTVAPHSLRSTTDRWGPRNTRTRQGKTGRLVFHSKNIFKKRKEEKLSLQRHRFPRRRPDGGLPVGRGGGGLQGLRAGRRGPDVPSSHSRSQRAGLMLSVPGGDSRGRSEDASGAPSRTGGTVPAPSG